MPRVIWLAPVRRTFDDIRPVLAPQGAVAGWIATDDGFSEAALFRGGTTLRLGRPDASRATFATAVSPEGIAAGIVRGDNDRDCRAVRFLDGGGLSPLGAPGKWSIVHASGPDGSWGGAAETDAGPTRPVVWTRQGRLIELPLPPGGSSGVVHAIAADGTAVGAAEPAPGRKWSACLWPAGGKPVLLPGLPGGTTARVRAIGSGVRLVGWADTDEAEMAAVAWDDGRIRNLGTLGDEPASAWGVDATGRIVGTSANSRKRMRAFLHEDGILDDCNGRVSLAPGDALEIATDIDATGRIVGLGRHEGRTWLFVLEPSPGESRPNTRAEMAPNRLGVDAAGRIATLPAHRARRVVVWFFCDCQQCHAVAKAWGKGIADGTVPVGAGVAVFSGNRARGAAFVKDTSWPKQSPFLLDPDARSAKEWGALPCPQAVVVDPRGRIVARARERGALHLVREATAALSVR
ncbi:MAG: hypothetical protein ACKO5K_01130 [Armatimonadota bacterium]